MVNEEQLVKLVDLPRECCLIHALNNVDPQKPGFDYGLLSTLVSLRKILNRISPGAQDFICQCLQQRFTDQEAQERGLGPSRVTAESLLNSHWVNN